SRRHAPTTGLAAERPNDVAYFPNPGLTARRPVESTRRGHSVNRRRKVSPDRRERRHRLDIGPAYQKLSKRESDESAEHVGREDPPALRGFGLGIEPALGGGRVSGAYEPE